MYYGVMLRSMGTKILIILSLFLMQGVFASEYDVASYKPASPMQQDFAEYMQSIREKIQVNWNNPELMEQGHAVIQFKVTRNGDLFAYDVKQSSGNAIFDEFAIDALVKSAPFDEFPINAKQDYITVCYSFDSSIVRTDRMKELVESSEKFINIDNEMARNLIDEAIKEADGDCVAYFLYARRHKLDKLLGDIDAAKSDIAECKRLKDIYDRRRIQTCKNSLAHQETPFGHFALANAYDVYGDYDRALEEIDKAISMTELNQAYKRYRAEIAARNK